MASKHAGGIALQNHQKYIQEAQTHAHLARKNAELRAHTNPERTFRVLALDGGGIRGVAVARILEEIELVTGQRIHDLFNLIIGTSTGGLLSVMMTVPVANPTKEDKDGVMSAFEAKNFYYQKGSTIFNWSWWNNFIFNWTCKSCCCSKYTRKGMHQVLNEIYDPNTTLQKAVQHVGVVVTDRVHKSSIVFTNRNEKSPAGDYIDNPPLCWVVPATSAAPLYFDPVVLEFGAEIKVTDLVHPKKRKVILEDGGVNANNPAALGFMEAKKILRSEGADLKRCQIDIVSVGTGTINPTGYDEDPADFDENFWSTATGYCGVFEEFKADPFKVSMKAYATHKRLQETFIKEEDPLYGKYSRIQFAINKHQAANMDDPTKDNLDSLCDAAETYLFKDKDKRVYSDDFKIVLSQISPKINVLEPEAYHQPIQDKYSERKPLLISKKDI